MSLREPVTILSLAYGKWREYEGKSVKVCGKDLRNENLQGGPAGEEDPGPLCTVRTFFAWGADPRSPGRAAERRRLFIFCPFRDAGAGRRRIGRRQSRSHIGLSWTIPYPAASKEYGLSSDPRTRWTAMPPLAPSASSGIFGTVTGSFVPEELVDRG